MKIVTPASELFLKRGDSVRLSKASNTLELRPELEIPRLDWQEYSHCHISDPLFDINLKWDGKTRAKLARLLKRESEAPPALSFHLARDYEKASINREKKYVPSGRALQREEMLENISTNAHWVREYFGSDLLIENNNYYPTGAYEIVTNPEFISEAIETSASGFLFDYAHAIVSAHNLGTELSQYIDALPLERTKQLHISAPELKKGEMIDAHGLPDLKLVETALNSVKGLALENPPVTIEYYQDAEQLLELLRTLRQKGGIE